MRDDEIELTRPCPIDLRPRVGRALARDRDRFHCDHCDQPVHLLSAMTQAEAAQLLAQRGRESMCIAYVHDPRGQIHFRPEPDLVPVTHLLDRRSDRRGLRASALALSLAACTPHGEERVEAVDLEAFADTEAEAEDVRLPPPPPPVRVGKRKRAPEPEPEELMVTGGAPPPLPPPEQLMVTAGGVPGGVPSRRPEKPTTVLEPLSRVMERELYTPEPDPRALAQTKTARFDRRDGKNVTSFCVDERGRVVDVETKRRFPGDPEIDAIIRSTLATWRFVPSRVGPKLVKVCTERTFKLSFRP